MYHGQISYSIVDRFINNRACQDSKYIIYENLENENNIDKNYSCTNENEMNEWITIDIYCKTRNKVQKLLVKEYEKIHQIFEELNEKERMEELLNQQKSLTNLN